MVLVCTYLSHLVISLFREAYFISPIQREHQCTDSCLTLSQFANSTNDLNVNTTLIFWPGKHTLDNNVTIFDIRQLLIVSNHSLKIPPKAEILCGGTNGFRFQAFSLELYLSPKYYLRPQTSTV